MAASTENLLGGGAMTVPAVIWILPNDGAADTKFRFFHRDRVSVRIAGDYVAGGNRHGDFPGLGFLGQILEAEAKTTNNAKPAVKERHHCHAGSKSSPNGCE